jgi:two-component system, LytTR family, sensor kinase
MSGTSSTATVNPFPVRLSRLAAIGLVVGFVCGTMSYFLQTWLSPGFQNQPQGMYVWVVLFNVLVWTTWLLLVPVTWALAAWVPITSQTRTLSLAFHSVASLVVAAGHCAIDAGLKLGVLWLAGQQTVVGRPLGYVPVFTWTVLFSFEWQVLIYWGIVAAYYAISASRALEWRRAQEAHLESRLVEARLESLQRQLNPHFFFNALNAVSTLIHRDTREAESMLVRLGDLLRAVFRSQVQQEVPLARELTLLEQYLDIQRVRFGGHLRTELDVAPAARDILVPVLILQPLAENAIKHGFAGRADGGTIRVSARRAGERLELTVSDDGAGLPAGQAAVVEGVGLSNTRARLAHLYPHQHAIIAIPLPQGGFAVTITIPWRTAPVADLADALDIPA